MTSADSTQGIAAFFDSYRRAFERFDASAIASHFALPAHITADADEIDLTAISDERAWIGQIEEFLDLYRRIQAASAQVLNLAVTELSPRLFQAVVRWALTDRAGHRLYDFQAAYTLARIAARLRITAIAHNEMPRYLQCVARVHAARAAGSGPEAAA